MWLSCLAKWQSSRTAICLLPVGNPPPPPQMTSLTKKKMSFATISLVRNLSLAQIQRTSQERHRSIDSSAILTHASIGTQSSWDQQLVDSAKETIFNRPTIAVILSETNLGYGWVVRVGVQYMTAFITQDSVRNNENVNCEMTLDCYVTKLLTCGLFDLEQNMDTLNIFLSAVMLKQT